MKAHLILLHIETDINRESKADLKFFFFPPNYSFDKNPCQAINTIVLRTNDIYRINLSADTETSDIEKYDPQAS